MYRKPSLSIFVAFAFLIAAHWLSRQRSRLLEAWKLSRPDHHVAKGGNLPFTAGTWAATRSRVPTTRTGWQHSKLASKVLTKPLWLWATRRSYPIRGRIFRLPALPVASQPGCRLVVLAGKSVLGDAAWAARSFLQMLSPHSAQSLGLDLYFDSADPAELRDAAVRWTRLFPGSRVRSTWEAVAAFTPKAPALAGLAKASPVGRKLAVLLAAQEEGNVLYTDSDVLLFHPAPELSAALREAGPALYLQERGGVLNGEHRLLAHAEAAGLPPPAAGLNSGLLFLPRGSLAWADAERLLAEDTHNACSWFIEQTIIALLLGASGARPLPAERYIVSARGQFFNETDEDYDALTARHFVTPVRHLMYARGMPLLWRRWQQDSSFPGHSYTIPLG